MWGKFKKILGAITDLKDVIPGVPGWLKRGLQYGRDRTWWSRKHGMDR